MIGLGFRIRWSGPVPKHVSRAFPRMVLGCYREMGELWHGVYRPKHFTRAGAQEYGYTPRRGEGESGKAFWRSYAGQKQKKLRHQLPLVWSGESRELARGMDLRVTRRSVRVVLHTPRLNLRPRGGRIHMAEEMRTISRAERGLLARRFEWALNLALQRIHEVTTVEVRSVSVTGAGIIED